MDLATTTFPTTHIRLAVKASFETFTKNLETILRRFDSSVTSLFRRDPELAVMELEAMPGDEELLLFSIFDHGEILNIYGRPRKAKQYLIGNALIASTMTRHNLGAALYAPLRVLVSEQSNETFVEYDQPSSLFRHLKNPEVDSVAKGLDQKLKHLVEKIQKLSQEH